MAGDPVTAGTNEGQRIVAETTIKVHVDPRDVIDMARKIAKHMTALANDLQTSPDSLHLFPGELTEEQARAFVDDHEFERKLQQLMRVHPQVLEAWIRKRERINGRTFARDVRS